MPGQMTGSPWMDDQPWVEFETRHNVHPAGGKFRGFRLAVSAVELGHTAPDNKE